MRLRGPQIADHRCPCLNLLGHSSQAMWRLSSASRMMLEATTPTLMMAHAIRLVVAGEISRCSKTHLRPQATWATIAIRPTHRGGTRRYGLRLSWLFKLEPSVYRSESKPLVAWVVCSVDFLPMDVLISESKSREYDGRWLREPKQFLHDAMPRAEQFLRRFFRPLFRPPK
jgi:hypothetical protein